MSEGLDLEHRTTVARLRELLSESELREDDVLVPNLVQNLSIVRDHIVIGYVDLLNGNEHVEIYEQSKEHQP